MNGGTRQLRQNYAEEPFFKRAQARAHAKARDPVRRTKIAAARRGKARPAHVVEAIRQAHLGSKHTVAARQKLSNTHKRLGTRLVSQGGRAVSHAAAEGSRRAE